MDPTGSEEFLRLFFFLQAIDLTREVLWPDLSWPKEECWPCRTTPAGGGCQAVGGLSGAIIQLSCSFF